MKYNIKQATIKFGKKKKKSTIDRIATIEKELDNLYLLQDIFESNIVDASIISKKE